MLCHSIGSVSAKYVKFVARTLVFAYFSASFLVRLLNHACLGKIRGICCESDARTPASMFIGYQFVQDRMFGVSVLRHDLSISIV